MFALLSLSFPRYRLIYHLNKKQQSNITQYLLLQFLHLQNATQNITFQNLKVKLQLLQFEQPGLNQGSSFKSKKTIISSGSYQMRYKGLTGSHRGLTKPILYVRHL